MTNLRRSGYEPDMTIGDIAKRYAEGLRERAGRGNLTIILGGDLDHVMQIVDVIGVAMLTTKHVVGRGCASSATSEGGRDALPG